MALFILLCFSCQHKEGNGGDSQIHKNLISFDNKFLRDLTSEELNNYTYGKGSIQKEQRGDTLYVTADFPWDGCADMEGDLVYKGDSLTLVYRLKEEVLCTEIIYYRLQYKILNKEKLDYKLKVEFQEKGKTSTPNTV
ncbi:hypothetical protein [Rufibacter sp. DG15C]|uniref:hypothetical protein n=1 Tax=Rufibacter sp. DG15C TaxID=1379909 RepID=UPI0012FB3E79|nr:hypothetical protein [Rufibacter sp. DG15C]